MVFGQCIQPTPDGYNGESLPRGVGGVGVSGVWSLHNSPCRVATGLIHYDALWLSRVRFSGVWPLRVSSRRVATVLIHYHAVWVGSGLVVGGHCVINTHAAWLPG